jgi:major membrane immunogen (membrane-anchored lipoprotein)
MKKNMVLLVVVILVVSIILSACSSAGKSNFPTGKFIKSGTENYGLMFNADGTFSIFNGDITYVKATYTVDGDVFTETSNDSGCETNVSFNYVFDGSNLTFKYVGDPDADLACDGRHADFNNVTYTLAK